MIQEYYTTTEVLKILKITRQTLWRLKNKKLLIPHKIMKKNLYKESDIKKLLGD